jgi:hypothetical protein
MDWSKQSLTLILSASLVLAAAPTGHADAITQSNAAPTILTPSMQPPSNQTGVESPNDLNQLVAPMALYPDNLVAQILAASSWPNEVSEANRWMRQHSDLSGTGLAEAVNRQAWDPSVKALTQFPLVLANMAVNLSWSWALGNAYATDPREVLDAIQVMRRRAQQAGHLTGTPQQVVTYEGDTIQLQPADAGTVYLPEYDPWLVYGEQLAPYPGWDWLPGTYVTEPDILPGLAVGIGAFAGYGWSWNHWGTDWRGRGVVYNQSPYRSYAPIFAGHPAFHGTNMASAPTSEFRGGVLHGAIGANSRGLHAFNSGRVGSNYQARGGFGFRGGFHFATGGFDRGSVHDGGFHGVGHR